MKYDDWPVARLIERETSRPRLLTRYRRQVARPDRVTVLWARDAWQYSARPPIKEANLAPTPITLDRLDGQGWADALRGARDCLDPRKRHRGRRRVPVTLLSSQRQVEMYVSPHLKIGTPLVEITARAMREARGSLEALYEFAVEQSRPAGASERILRRVRLDTPWRLLPWPVLPPVFQQRRSREFLGRVVEAGVEDLPRLALSRGKRRLGTPTHIDPGDRAAFEVAETHG